MPESRTGITCQRCDRTSWHPKDVEEGYCGNCHAWTHGLVVTTDLPIEMFRRSVAGDLQRLAQPSGASNPRTLGGSMAGPGGPHDHGATVIDATDCILLDHTEVCTIDTVRGGALGGQAIFMTLDGRINKRTDRARVGYIFDTDGAAAIITELLALADRFGPEMLDDVTRRLTSLYREKNIDLAWLRAAIDNAIENAADLT